MIGNDSDSAQTRLSDQELLYEFFDFQRQSISGVSLDEEMTQIVKFQHAYVAAAKFLTTVDEMLAQTLNMI